MKKIHITCEGAGLLPLVQFTELQGELKTLFKEDFEKLKKEILTQGFSFTVAVWMSKDDQCAYILDGHQRVRVVRHLVEHEGYECEALPYSITYADTYQQAKRKLLGAASQYGKIQNDGLLEYTKDMAITPEELLSSYRFADMNIQKYIDANYDQTPEETKHVEFDVAVNPSEDDADEEEEKFNHKCPRCSFQFNHE